MAEREIKTTIGTYINEWGNSEFGFKGDKVQVHEDFVDRFDEFNIDAGDEVVPERVGVEVISPATASKSGSASGAESKNDTKKAPAKKS